MASSLAGRTLCILGGNGFVGSVLAQQAVNLGANVYAVSRSGDPSSKSAWTNKVHWVKGDSMHPETFKNVLEQSEAVVHTIGTIIDTSLTQMKNPGEQGTYEHMNLETAKSIGKALGDLNQNKKMVYLSASRAPPFLKRYLDTKIEAENYLFSIPSIRTTVLRPGFIYSDDQPHKKLLSYPLGIYANTFKFVDRVFSPNTELKNLLHNFDFVDTTVHVRAVALSALIASFDPRFDGRVLYNDDMETLTNRFLERGYEFPSCRKQQSATQKV